MESLNVFIEVQGQPVKAGELARINRDVIFRYDDAFLNSNIRGISHALPKARQVFEGNDARIFFENILPEAEQRKIIADYAGVSEQNFFGLLKRFGEECAGALIITPRDSIAREDPHYEPLSGSAFDELVSSLDITTPAATYDDYRLSLAGAQAKVSVYRDEQGGVHLPLGSAPSTHIIKPFNRRFTALPVNEHTCTTLAASAGLNACRNEIVTIDSTKVLIIERYDRIIEQDSITRLHQEDFCQALGYPYSMKYEAEGGPSFRQCVELLVNVSSTPAKDKIQLIKWFIFNYIIGNADAHAKNIALLYHGANNEHVSLAPLYDLVSTAIYSNITKCMAMAIGGEFDPESVTADHWKTFCDESGITIKTLRKYIKEITTPLTDALASMNAFPADEIAGVIRSRLSKLERI